ncbi:MAG: hypothetical protein KDB86_13565 [Actinobacteria bacterium]|nr:hypothetical protein [Actinomycetota bacterium]
MQSWGHSDTSANVVDRQVEIWRQMSPAEKYQVVLELNRDVERMAEAGVRQRYPDASDREVFLRLAALRNGRDLSIAAYGWDPEIEGW